MLTSSTISLLEKTERPTTCLSATSHSASASPTCRCSATPAPKPTVSTPPTAAAEQLRESGAAAPRPSRAPPPTTAAPARQPERARGLGHRGEVRGVLRRARLGAAEPADRARRRPGVGGPAAGEPRRRDQDFGNSIPRLAGSSHRDRAGSPLRTHARYTMGDYYRSELSAQWSPTLSLRPRRRLRRHARGRRAWHGQGRHDDARARARLIAVLGATRNPGPPLLVGRARRERPRPLLRVAAAAAAGAEFAARAARWAADGRRCSRKIFGWGRWRRAPSGTRRASRSSFCR